MRPNLNEARSKIVATVGPACSEVDKLTELVECGVDVFRINTAHGVVADFEELLEKIKLVRERTNFPVAILLDLSGPKIRLGQLVEDSLDVEPGDEISFVRGESAKEPRQLCSNYAPLVDEVKTGNRIMLADGTISLDVIEKSSDGFKCKVLTAGTVRSRQGINLPGVTLSVSALRPQDIENAIWGAKNDVDLISLSFVRTPQDVHSLRELLKSHDSKALVVAKIEKREALECLEDIVDAADAIMVARGDLGVEIDVAETPVAQKKIISACRERLKPVIVATQMLESMHHNSRPTRAEASDVANAILDGADACMLSGETAIGDYPAQAVEMMNRIMLHTEQMLRDAPSERVAKVFDRVHPVTSAVTYSAASIAQAIGAKLVVVATKSGGTAWVKSKQRNFIPTLGVSDNPSTLRRMCLFWGIMPHQAKNVGDAEALFEVVCEWGRKHEWLEDGDNVVVVTGTGIIDNTHNQLIVRTVGQ